MTEKKKREYPRIKVPAELEIVFDSNREGPQGLNFTAGEATFTDTETGEKIGEILNIIPVGLKVRSKATGRDYNVDLFQLLAAVLEFEEKERGEPDAKDA